MKNRLYDILLRAKENDEKAITELIERFEPKIKKLSSTFPPAERDDLEQELRIQLVHSVEKFNIEKNQASFWSQYEDMK
ncbi:helix-turn-helix domain-containing protein [Halobacillus sp. A1]|uniref:helix-turn-helix domain-containing protein n=1 Tax=Halobacillus sp. A1 TaxID=2880262 RepID=UPI0020A62A13|nr:helix-turn-helix domain-containing protein [Halobacillus sp. A1]MCP3030079.1 helix-turn-helix domain-containing protein [Halobacillus sp. A1]